MFLRSSDLEKAVDKLLELRTELAANHFPIFPHGGRRQPTVKDSHPAPVVVLLWVPIQTQTEPSILEDGKHLHDHVALRAEDVCRPRGLRTEHVLAAPGLRIDFRTQPPQALFAPQRLLHGYVPAASF